MSNKGILGGKVANAIDIHQEALHLSLEPKVMKFSIIENARMLPRPLGNGAFSGFSRCSMRQTSISSQWIDSCGCLNTFSGLSEALVLGILKTKRLLGRVRVYGFN